MPKTAVANLRQLIVPLLILAAVVFVDQLSKMWAVGNLIEGETHQVVGNFFQLKLVYNEGGAMGTSLGNNTFYLISGFVILIMVLYFIYTNRNLKFISRSMSLIAGGAIGNLIDRIQGGRVVDFLDFDFFNLNLFGYNIDRWWKFNVADAAITVGIIILMLYVIISSPKPKNTVQSNISSFQD